MGQRQPPNASDTTQCCWTSIENFGLIHPVIVVPKGNRYRLLVGQRRFSAFQSLNRITIHAIIIKPLTLKTERIVSFGENIHRRKLPYNDTIAVCEELFKDTTYQAINRFLNPGGYGNKA